MAAGDLITQDGQLEFNGLLLGGGTVYGWRQLDGWDDLPPLQAANATRPSQHGSYPGQLVAGERVITWDFLISTTVAAFPAAVAALRAATAVPSGDVEIPLVIQLAGQKLLVNARCTQRAVGAPKTYPLGYVTGALQFVASQPRRYTAVQSTASTGLPTAGTGLVYPLVYPLDYGSGGTPGAVQALNAGDTATPCVLTVRGPATMPSVANQTLNKTLEFSITLAGSDVLTVDTAAGTVLLNGTANRLYTLTAKSTPVEDWLLAPSINDVAFRATAYDAAALLTVTWRSAYL